MTTSPLDLFLSDRDRARQTNDPMAAVCTVANVDAQQTIQLRTLVLRELDGHLALFVNATAPKWPYLQNTIALHTYWPSVQVQYRIQATTCMIDPAVVATSWLQRPPAPKRLDHYYAQKRQQSSEIQDRATLLSELDQVQLNEPLTAPDNAKGLRLTPFVMERLDLTQANGVHQRELFRLVDETWQTTTLVP